MCNNQNMADQSKPIGGVDEVPIAPGSKGKRNRQSTSAVRLSPTDYLKLLPEPPLAIDTMNFFARDLAQHFQRVDRLKRLASKKGIVFGPERVHLPNLAKLDALERELRTFPTRRRFLTVKQFPAYADALRRMRRTMAGLTEQMRKSQHRDRQEAYLARVGRLFLDAPPDVLESFILNRSNNAGSNLHATALARMRNDGLSHEKLAEWGRRGAQARWAKRRA